MEYHNPSKRLITLVAMLIGSALVLLSVARQEIANILDVAPPEKRSLGAVGGAIPEEGSQKESIPALLPQPELSAHAYIVRFIGETRPLMRQREWKTLAPASLTKLLTAVIAREELPATTWIQLSETAKDTEQKISGAFTGEFFLRDDVIRLALVGSYNDAARALGEAVEKGKTGYLSEPYLYEFSDLMNKKIDEIGLNDTSFKNPTGLDGEEHVTSAEDLANLSEYIWREHQRIWEITRLVDTAVYSDRGREFRIESTNDLLKEFPAILGGKTGFTDNAGGTLLFLYPVRPDKIAIAVVLGSDDRFADGRKIIEWLESINR